MATMFISVQQDSVIDDDSVSKFFVTTFEGSSETFTELMDTPSSKTDQAGKVVVVGADERNMRYAAPTNGIKTSDTNIELDVDGLPSTTTISDTDEFVINTSGGTNRKISKNDLLEASNIDNGSTTVATQLNTLNDRTISTSMGLSGGGDLGDNDITIGLDIPSAPILETITSEHKLLVQNGGAVRSVTRDTLLAGVAGGMMIRGTISPSVVNSTTLTVVGDSLNSTITQGTAPANGSYVSARGFSYLVTLSGALAQTGIDINMGGPTGSQETFRVFDQDQLVWTGDRFIHLATGDNVVSVHGRTGAVTSQAGDYVSSEITRSATDNLSELTVESALVAINTKAEQNDDDISRLDWQKFGRTQVAVEVTRALNNEKYAASGFVHFGKHIHTGLVQVPINEGLYTGGVNTLFMGRKHSLAIGKSKHDLASVNIAGICYNLEENNTTDIVKPQLIKFPQAPDGTVTYDSATGVIRDFTTYNDPRYGNVAPTTQEAVARAFEGVVKNGDFRNGTNDWASSTGTITNSEYTSTGEGDLVQLIPIGNLTANTSYIFTAQLFIPTEATNVTLQCNTDQGVNRSGTSSVGAGGIISDRNKFVTVRMQVSVGASPTVQLRMYHAEAGAKLRNVSFRKTTNQVVTERVDMWGFEAFLEEVTATNPTVYPNGLIQSQAASMDGIATIQDTRAITYYAVFDGDTGSRGRGLNWFNLTDAQKQVVLSNPNNNIYLDDQGRVLQWRLRQRTIAGSGNGDWLKITPVSDDIVLSFQNNANALVSAQGINNNVLVDGYNNAYRQPNSQFSNHNFNGLFEIANSGTPPTVAAVNGECYFLVCGTAQRLNQGAYHPSFNPLGAARFTGDTFWYNTTASKASILNCFQNAVKGNIGQLSGRPDGRFYDAIYASGQGGVQQDLRFSVYEPTKAQLGEKLLAIQSGSYRGYEKAVMMRRAVVFNQNPSNPNVAALRWEGTNDTVLWSHLPARLLQKHIARQGGVGQGQSEVNPTYRELGFVSTNANLRGGTDLNASVVFVYQQSATLGDIVLVPFELPYSLGHQFTQVDVIGDPARILQTPDLRNGWVGSWIPVIPDGTAKSYPYTRKKLAEVVSKGYGLRTDNNGNSWNSSVQTGSGIDITNTYANGATSFVSSHIYIIPYTAQASMTEDANNAVVYGDVGNVFFNAFFLPSWGGLLNESLIGKVATSNSGGTGRTNYVMQRVAFNGSINDGSLVGTINDYGYHSSITSPAPNNNSPAVKALNYLTEENGQLFMQFAYTELKYTNNSWNDDGRIHITNNQSTRTDGNNQTVLYGTARTKIPLGWVHNKD